MAVAAAKPLASPKWLLPWLRHAAPPNAEVRTVVVHEGSELIGIAPFTVQRGSLGRADYRLFGVPVAERNEPLALPGQEEHVGAEVARVLANANPRASILALEAIDLHSAWPERLARHYPGRARPAVIRGFVLQTPTLQLDEHQSFDHWMASRSGNFRSQMQRMRRRLTDDGGIVRMTEAGSDLERDVNSFMRLHLGRWEKRGGSGLADTGIERMLLEAANELLPDGRFRLWLVELKGKPIGAGLFIAGGGEMAYFNGGFDEEFARYRPALIPIAAAIEDGFARGDSRLDFGGGPQPYKLRFADGRAPLAWISLRPRTARYALTRAELLKSDLHRSGLSAFHRLPEQQQKQVKRLLRR